MPPVDLQQLADKLEIGELVARYNMAVDDGEADALVALFTDDATVTFAPSQGDPRQLRSREEIRSLGERAPGQQVHFCSDAVIEVDGDRATHVCSLLVLKPTGEGSAAAVTNRGRYHDELVRTADGWRIASRTARLA